MPPLNDQNMDSGTAEKEVTEIISPIKVHPARTGDGGSPRQWARPAALMLCLFGIFVWGLKRASAEIELTSRLFPKIAVVWRFFVRWICPLSIAIILATLFGL